MRGSACCRRLGRDAVVVTRRGDRGGGLRDVMLGSATATATAGSVTRTGTGGGGVVRRSGLLSACFHGSGGRPRMPAAAPAPHCDRPPVVALIGLQIRRGKKTVSTVSLADLPEVLPLKARAKARRAVREDVEEKGDVEDEDEVDEVKPPRPKRRARATKTETVVDGDDVPAPKRRARATKTETVVDGDDVPASKKARRKTISLAEADEPVGTDAAAAPKARAKRTQAADESAEADAAPADADAAPAAAAAPKARAKRTQAAVAKQTAKKTRTRVSLEDLPQGPIDFKPLPPLPDDSRAYPTVIMQARQNMDKFDNCVLLTRVGGFYELYFEQAAEYAPLLNIKVGEKKTNAGPVAMAGFPFFQLDRHLKVLVQEHNCYVAIAEEFPNDASDKIRLNGLMHDRKVSRIITPGTLIDEAFIDPYANNYVMAIHLADPYHAAAGEAAGDGGDRGDGMGGTDEDGPVQPPITPTTLLGVAWLDASTGQFYTQQTSLADLPAMLSRVCPREVVVDEVLQSQDDHVLFSILAEEKQLITFTPHTTTLPLEQWTRMLESEIPAKTIKTFTTDEVEAGSLLLQYVGDRLLNTNLKLQPPVRRQGMDVVTIDKNSMRSLEITRTIQESTFRGSLLHAIRRTVTKSGARLLAEWVSAPSTSLKTITERQDLVEHFIRDPDLCARVIQLLKRSHDSQRLLQKIATGRGAADDLVRLANTIAATEDVVKLLEATAGRSFTPLLARISLQDASQLASRIRTSIDEEGLSHKHELHETEAGQLLALARDVVETEGTAEDEELLPKSPRLRRKASSIRDHYAEDNLTFIMKADASRLLRRLHRQLAEQLEEKATLTDEVRKRLGLASLTLRWSPTAGHVGHVRGRDVQRRGATAAGPAVSASRSTRSFLVPEWTQLGQRIHLTRYTIQAEEGRVFADLRAAVVRNLVRIRRNAAVLDELDITTSFARLAVELRLNRPVLDCGTAHQIVAGRHPTVEGGLRDQGRTFTANDCLVGSPGQGRLWLITGPNMAGKSTYLRQNTLITILAQVGSYVPAAHATIGLVDAIFSRVGSADNLYHDQSTFMVEMLETANILRTATPRSLVIMDEIGRGTTPEDGTAVAFAALHHLVTANRCRTLFATHFHVLADWVRERGMHVATTATDTTTATTGTATSSATGTGTAAGTPSAASATGSGAVEMYCTNVEEDSSGGYVYVHRLRKGINRRSHALKVARLAGLPEAAINVAKDILGGMEKAHESKEKERGWSLSLRGWGLGGWGLGLRSSPVKGKKWGIIPMHGDS